ncbi:MAG TPA: RNA polymerase sigma-70 factor [Chitinophagaceae bacterium]|nr:RNA polymerase sigma-70 factor [Chitinophagaceae bacterium]
MSNAATYSVFESVFKEHYNALANYAFSILRDRSNAEDVVQDVFVKLWQNQPEIIGTPQVKFYLLTATRNTCITLLRKESGKVHVHPDEVQLADSSESSGSATPHQDIHTIINNALSTLPPQCQAIFRLSRLGKLTYQQIADELGLSVKTVENQVGKALRLMREYAKQHNIPFSLLWIGVLQNFASCN